MNLYKASTVSFLIVVLSLLSLSTRTFSLTTKGVCFGLALDSIVSTDCSDLRIHFLQKGICLHPFQTVDVDLDVSSKSIWFSFAVQSIPLSLFSKVQLLAFPDLVLILSKMCPSYMGEQTEVPPMNTFNTVYYGLVDRSNMNITWPLSFQGVKQFTYESDEVVFSKNELFKTFSQLNSQANYFIYAAKEYAFYAGQLVPRSPLVDEVNQAIANPFTHTPNLFEFVKYEVDSILPSEKLQIFHEAFEVCLKNDKDQTTQHLLVARMQNGQFPDFWSSYVLVIYLGEGDCDLDSKIWLSNRDENCFNDLGGCFSKRAEKTNQNVPLDRLWEDTNKYLEKFSIYNGLFNCQHFSSGIFDMYFGETLDYVNWEIMKTHSYFSGLVPKGYWLDAKQKKFLN